MSVMQSSGCCCSTTPPCPATMCGLNAIANNGSIRLLTMPPLFDAATSFTLSVGSSATFGCVYLTPYSDGWYEWQTCFTDYECCCDVIYNKCINGGGCGKGICEQVEYGDYHPFQNNFNFMIEPAHYCIGAQPWVDILGRSIVGSNLAQHTWSGNFTYPYNCLNGSSANGCNNNNYCNPPWATNYFPMVCAAVLNIDGSVGAPPHTNYANISGALRVIDIFSQSGGVSWYNNRPPCDCKCPFIELSINVNGVIWFSITDLYNQPPSPVDYSTLLPSGTALTYRKRLVKSKALNYYTYYDWINDTTEPFHLFMIQSGEDGVHTFCNQDAVNGSIPSCSSDECPGCVSTGGSDGHGPSYYVDSYGPLCSSASSETTNAPGISSASCYVYPDEIQLSIAANYPPVTTGISPSTGTISGGTTVVVTGTGLWGCHQVDVDGTLAPSFIVNTSSTTQFSFNTPPHAAGVVTVTFTWSWGTTTKTFTYV